jgi:glucose-6-phosphate 1-dehydrogenase
MNHAANETPVIFVMFGAAGIQSYRLILPALHVLHLHGRLPRHFHENRIYRIDHFPGKETVRNILALCFANPIFEPVWNRNHIDHVVITVAGSLGVEHSAGYHEGAGALRDTVQNHLLQLPCLVAMGPPTTCEVDDIRNRKMDVMHALRPIPAQDTGRDVARGQSAAGWIGGRIPPDDFPNYADGTRGPESAEALIAADGFVCYTPEAWRHDDE